MEELQVTGTQKYNDPIAHVSTLDVDGRTVQIHLIRSGTGAYPFRSNGWGNGYIQIRQDHPMYKQPYDHHCFEGCQELTYSAMELWDNELVWVMGWDTSHCYHDHHHGREYVKLETEKLAQAIHRMSIIRARRFLE